jgi:hypothetical protein
MSAQVDKIRSDLETAKATHSAGLDSLKNNGRAVYSPEEEARRRNELTATYQAAQRVAQENLQSAIAGAEQAIVEAGVRDPLAQLASGDLEKAGPQSPCTCVMDGRHWRRASRALERDTN